MKINVDLVLKARKQKSWSQDELAIASGLNLRTIQRIESEASASLQSKKALASALDLDVQDLDCEEKLMPQKWEYKVVETKDRTALQPELDKAGADGWELVSVTSMFNTMMTKVRPYAVFQASPVVGPGQSVTVRIDAVIPIRTDLNRRTGVGGIP